MSVHPTEPPPRGWAELLAELVGGAAHALNNRAATLRALHAVLAADGAGRAHDLLEAEILRVEATAALLHLAGGRPRTQREAIVPADLLRDAAALYGTHDLLRQVPLAVEPGPAPAVLASWTPLLHALLVLLDGAGRHAAASDGAVRVAARDAPPEVEVIVACPAAGDTAAVEAAVLRAAEPLAAAGGAEVQVRREEGELCFVLAAPTLAAARAREGGGAPG